MQSTEEFTRSGRLAARIGRLFAVPRHAGIGRLFLWALLPGLIGLLVVLADQYRSQRAFLDERAMQTSQAFAAIIEAKLAVVEGKLSVLATSPFLQSGDLPRFYDQAQQILAAEDFVSAVVLIDRSGRQVLNTLRPLGAELPNSGHFDLVRQTFETGRPAVSALYLGGVSNKPYVSVEVPVREGDRVKYVLDAGIPAERLSALLAERHLEAGWVASLLDGQGHVIGRSQNAAQFVGGLASGDLLAAMARGGEGRLASRTLEGLPSFVAFSRSAPSGWTMSVALSRSVLHSGLYRPMGWMALAMVLFMGVGLILARLFTRHVQQALDGLGAATKAAKSGDLSATAPLAGPREIVHLADQFNRLQEVRRANADEIQRQQAEISQLAFHDPLTRLPNRRLLADRLQQALAQADRQGTLVAVCYLDLDGFKSINDLHGHEVGDAVLVEISRRIGSAVRANDTVARLGGDEFVLLLTNLNSAIEGQIVLRRLLEALSEPLPVQRAHLFRVSASIGVNFYPGDDGDCELLLRHADEAMYRAKRAGRNQIKLFRQPAVELPAAAACEI